MKLSELEKRVEELELDVYDTPACYKYAFTLWDGAADLFFDVLGYFDLAYSSPGEPVAENEEKNIVIPLANGNDGMLTSEEEEAVLADRFELPSDLYQARLRVQQARGVLEDGWQFGLEYPEETEDIIVAPPRKQRRPTVGSLTIAALEKRFAEEIA